MAGEVSIKFTMQLAVAAFLPGRSGDRARGDKGFVAVGKPGKVK